jgi:hypothetical protein
MTKDNRSPSQADRILGWLQQGRSINQEECTSEFGCLRLAARIHELKQRGHRINKKMEKTCFPAGRAARYALVGAAPSTGRDSASWRLGGHHRGDQVERVIELLVTSPKGITQGDANRVGSIRLAATMARLREGLPVTTRWEGTGTTRYVRYSLDLGAWCGMEAADV